MDSGAFPDEGMELTHLFVVSELERAKSFYRDVLGAFVYREYGNSSCVLQFLGNWILLVTGGGPTEDKPQVSLAPPSDPNQVSAELIIRVPDCRRAYEVLRSRGAQFLTPPHDWGEEVRCFFWDYDGHLLEISQLV
jgi:catechol 2,3-dioxygenase-like lactoylglutathione lyase family enzyme